MSFTHLKLSVTTALDHFDLDLDLDIQSQVTGIFGPSGAGKTSLIKCLAGLQPHTKGYIAFKDSVWLDSQQHIYLPPEQRHIGYVPQEGLLFPNKNVQQNLLIGVRSSQKSIDSYSLSGSPSLQSVCELLELSPLLDRKVNTLSGGERQRVALGRAICSSPELLLLDEPLASLDIQLRRKILPFLRRIRQELNIPMILISHNPSEIQALCDEVLIINKGKKLLFGATDKIMLNPNTLAITQCESFENILPAKLLKHQSSPLSSNLILGKNTNGPTLTVNKVARHNNTELLVGIPARDIILAKYKPEAISARNILLAVVTNIQDLEGLRLITTVIKTANNEQAVKITAELSVHGWDSLNLSIGDDVYLVIKATSCILYQ